MKCQLCSGTGKIVSERVQPQRKPKPITCVACHGSGEVEEIQGSKKIITIYKAHGVFASEMK